MNPAIFREYDIRGIAEKDFDVNFAFTLGQAFGTYARLHGESAVAVGYDCRPTSNTYASALRRGLTSTGIHVFDIGMCPTPLMYFSLEYYGISAGIQVTGSHNPSDQNGFKLCMDGVSIYGKEIQEIRNLINLGEFMFGTGDESTIPIIQPYQNFLLHQLKKNPYGIRVVVDAGNGTGGVVAPYIFSQLGCESMNLFCTPDGKFPNHHPDPTVPQNLQQLISAVREQEADIGIAYDGDADRLGLVDHTGRILWGDQILAIFARDVLKKHPGATIVSEVKCSQNLFDDINQRGGNAIMWKVGHSLIKAKMRETGALLGGEMSGHIFFADSYFGYDDAIYASCRMLELIHRENKSLNQLTDDLPRSFATPEIRIPCPDSIKFPLIEKIHKNYREKYEIVDIDGIRIRFSDGWGLIRASNTEPMLALRIEATSEEKLDEYRAIISSIVKEEMASL